MSEVVVGRDRSASYGAVEQLALAEWYTVGNVLRVRDSLLLTPSFGAIWYTGLDLGFPAVRDQVSDNPDSDGTYDTTSLHGARSVSVSLLALDDAFEGPIQDFRAEYNSAAYWVERLAAWQSPMRRNMRLYYRLRGNGPRWMDVRAGGMDAPINTSDPSTRAVQMRFVNPSGRSYSFDTGPDSTVDGRTRTSILFSGQEISGASLPMSLPLSFPTPPLGADAVRCRGNTATPVLLQVTSDPQVATVNPSVTVQHIDERTGAPDAPPQTISLAYTLDPGQYLSIDTRSREVFLGGDRRNRLGRYLRRSIWPQLHPGLNRVNLSAATPPGPAATATIVHFDAYL